MTCYKDKLYLAYQLENRGPLDLLVIEEAVCRYRLAPAATRSGRRRHETDEGS